MNSGIEMNVANDQSIKECAESILADAPDGMKFMELVNGIVSVMSDKNPVSVRSNLNRFLRESSKIERISRGLYRHIDNKKNEEIDSKLDEDQKIDVIVENEQHQEETISVSERDFYASFAEWLEGELGEVNECDVLGGNIFQGRWQTPDVIGVFRSYATDPVKFEPQITSAEVKIDPRQTVVAFGQAVAYRLFSHKVYLVVPKTTSRDDINRLDALGSMYGIGVVTFDLAPENPNYTLRLRASLGSPDMFYVNQIAKKLIESKSDFRNFF